MQLGYRNGIWPRKMNHANNKRKTTNNGCNRTAKSRKNQNVRIKGKLQVLSIDIVNQLAIKEKRLKKSISDEWGKLLKAKPSRRNLSKGINTWSIVLVRYPGPFWEWTREELQQKDQKTRNLMTIHKALCIVILDKI